MTTKPILTGPPLEEVGKDLDPLGQAVTDYIDVLEGKKPAGVAQIGGEQELTNEQRSRIPYIMALYHDCFLCGAEPPPYGSYTWKMGDETIITPLCVACARIVTVKDIIKAELRKRVRR